MWHWKSESFDSINDRSDICAKITLFGKTYFAEELGSNEARVTRLKSPESATDIAGDHWTLRKYLIKDLHKYKQIRLTNTKQHSWGLLDTGGMLCVTILTAFASQTSDACY